MTKSKVSLFEDLKIYGQETSKAGDVILYKAVTTPGGSLTAAGQTLASLAKRSKGGHYNTVSAGISRGNSTDGAICKVAHYVYPTIYSEALEGKTHSFVILSPRDQGLRTRINSTYLNYVVRAATASEYSLKAAIGSIFSSKTTNTTSVPPEENMFCSKFVMNVLKKVNEDLKADNSIIEGFDVSSSSVNSSPKNLESVLISQAVFDSKHNISEQGCADIKHLIEAIYNKFSNGTSMQRATAAKMKELAEQLAAEEEPIHMTKLLQTMITPLAQYKKLGGLGSSRDLEKLSDLAIAHGYSARKEIKPWIREAISAIGAKPPVKTLITTDHKTQTHRSGRTSAVTTEL